MISALLANCADMGVLKARIERLMKYLTAPYNLVLALPSVSPRDLFRSITHYGLSANRRRTGEATLLAVQSSGVYDPMQGFFNPRKPRGQKEAFECVHFQLMYGIVGICLCSWVFDPRDRIDMKISPHSSFTMEDG